MDAHEDTAAIEATVRGYYDALSSGRSGSEYVTGPFGEWLRLMDAALGEARRQTTVRVSIERLEVEHVEGAQAVASLDVLIDAERRVPFLGRNREASRHGGPVVLERVDGSWRMLDWTVRGHSVLDGVFFDPRGGGEVDGVSLDVLGVRLGPLTTWVVVRLRNATGRELRVREVALAARRLGPLDRYVPAGMGLPPVTVPVGESTAVIVTVHRFPPSTARVRVFIELFDGASKLGLDVPIDLRGDEPDQVAASGRRPTGLIVSMWVNQLTLAVAASIALLVWSANSIDWRFTVAFDVVAAAYTFRIVRGGIRVVGRRPTFVAPLVLLAAFLLCQAAFLLVRNL